MNELEQRLEIVMAKCSRLREENARLRAMLAADGLKVDPPAVIQQPQYSPQPGDRQNDCQALRTAFI